MGHPGNYPEALWLEPVEQYRNSKRSLATPVSTAPPSWSTLNENVSPDAAHASSPTPT